MTSPQRRPFPSQRVRSNPDHLDVLTRAGLRPASRRVWLAPRLQVLARSLYRQQRFDLSAAPAAQRRAALGGQMLAWSPFEHSRFLAALGPAAGGQSELGLGLAWDSDALGSLPGGPAKPGAAMLPELLLRPPLSEGLRLVACLEGTEAQLWHQGLPLASRWWPRSPQPDEWDSFVRDTSAVAAQAGLPALAPQAPEATDPGWLERPWLRSFTPGTGASGLASWERLAFTAVACALLGLSGQAAHQAWQANERLGAAQAELQQLRTDIAPALAARERALGLAARAQGLSQAMATVLPVELLAAVAQALPAKGAQLRELEYTEARLVLGLDLAPEVTRASVVGSLQANPWFTDVKEGREQPGRNWARFEMRLSGVQPPASVRAAASAPAAAGLPVVPAVAGRGASR